jgi:hypothetical protein
MPYGKEICASDLETVGAFKVMLMSVGNPDHGQNPFLSLPGVRSKNVAVKTLKEASDVCRKFIDDNGLGGGNWSGGDVFKENVIVARVSYNGRVWHPNKVVLDTVSKRTERHIG